MSAARDERARAFAALHRPGDPLILYNVWDTGSARVVGAAGAKAIATGSWSVAAAQGHEDGEKMSLDLVVANAARIAACVDLPVTIDLESGYGDPAAAAAGVWAAGAVGCNLEDRIVGGEGLRPAEEQAARLAAVREAVGPLFFVNARTDVFLTAPPEEHEALVDEAVRRARAYAAAGASGVFVPGLVDEEPIARICAESPLPVNVMVWKGTPPLRRLAELGVARISHAGAPWRVAMMALEEAGRAAHDMIG